MLYVKSVYPTEIELRIVITIFHKLLRSPSNVTGNPTFLLQSYCRSTEKKGERKGEIPRSFGDNIPFPDWFSDQISDEVQIRSGSAFHLENYTCTVFVTNSVISKTSPKPKSSSLAYNTSIKVLAG